MTALPVTTASVVNGSEVRVAVDRLGLQRRKHRRADPSARCARPFDIESAAVRDQSLPRVHDAADALDADGLAAAAPWRASVSGVASVMPAASATSLRNTSSTSGLSIRLAIA